MNKKRRIMLMAGVLSGCLVMANAQADHNVRYIIIDDGYAHHDGDYRWAKKHHRKHHEEYRYGDRDHYRNKYRRDHHEYDHDRHYREHTYLHQPDRPHQYRSHESYRPYRSDSRIGGRLVIDF